MSALLAYIASQVWLMEPAVFSSLEMIVARHDRGEKLSQGEINAITREDVYGPMAAAAGANADWRSQGYWNDGGVAVIPMTGVISKYSNLVNGSSQPRGTSVESMRAAFRAAQADTKVKARMFLVDSPGGSVADIAEFAAEISAGSQTGKPTSAYINGLGASAAVWLASQTSRVVASRGAQVGSIGVYSGLVDSSKAAEMEGIKVHLIQFGANKGAGMPGVPVTQANIDAAQATINRIGQQFVADVAAGRRVSLDVASKWADGRVHIGHDAAAMGLVDAIDSYEGAIAQMQNVKSGDARDSGRIAASLQVGGTDAATSGGGTGMRLTKLLLSAGAAGIAAIEGGGGGGGGGSATGNPAGSGQGGSGSSGNAGGNATGVLANLDDIRRESAAAGRREGEAAALARLSGLRAAVQGFEHVAGVSELLAAAEKDGNVSVASFQASVLDKVRGGIPARRDVDVSMGASGFDKKTANFELVCIQKAHPEIARVIDEGGPKADTVSRRLGYFGGEGLSPAAQASKAFANANQSGLRSVRMQTIMGEFVQQAGFAASQDPQDLMSQIQSLQFRRAAAGPQAAGNTTSDFPGFLSNVARKVALASFDLQETTWQFWCGRGSNADFKNADLLSLSEGPNLLLRLEGAPAKRASLNERKSQVKVNTYSREFAWTYQMVRNDDLNAFASVPIMFSAAGKRLPQQLLSGLLESNPTMLYDSIPLFAGYDPEGVPPQHLNYAVDGTTDCGPLDYDTLYKAYTKMTQQTGFGEDKGKIVITPKFLVVHPSNYLKARQIAAAEFIPKSGVDREPNVLQGMLQVISDPYLINPTAWYLAGDRLNPSLVVHFLDGVEEPAIFQKPMTTPMEMAFEVNLFGVGVAAVNHENIYRNDGIAP